MLNILPKSPKAAFHNVKLTQLQCSSEECSSQQDQFMRCGRYTDTYMNIAISEGMFWFDKLIFVSWRLFSKNFCMSNPPLPTRAESSWLSILCISLLSATMKQNVKFKMQRPACDRVGQTHFAGKLRRSTLRRSHSQIHMRSRSVLPNANEMCNYKCDDPPAIA